MGITVFHQKYWDNIMKALLLVLSVAHAYGGVPQQCKTVYETKCWDEPREKCKTEQKPYTVTVHDTHCVTHHEEKCNTEYENKVEYVDREECILYKNKSATKNLNRSVILNR